MYLIGTDEAGYGPNLGPLVVAGSVWEMPEGSDPYELLAECIVANGRSRGDDNAPLVVADSKRVYKPGGGLGGLERGVFALLGLLDVHATRWRELCDRLDPSSTEWRATIPWYADYDRPVPVDASPRSISGAERLLARVLPTAGVRPHDIQARLVYPEPFNRLVEQTGSKGTVLSGVTLELVATLCRGLPDGPIHVVCDKHGGRNRYRPFLEDHFPEAFIEIAQESGPRSVYRFGPRQRRITITFQSKGESHLPAALASMTAKYLRELSMHAVNAFWSTQVENLHPTAGYPQDARRFRKEIDSAVSRLGIAEEVFWRAK